MTLVGGLSSRDDSKSDAGRKSNFLVGPPTPVRSERNGEAKDSSREGHPKKPRPQAYGVAPSRQEAAWHKGKCVSQAMPRGTGEPKGKTNALAW